MLSPLRIGIAGLGTVGASTAKILLEQKGLLAERCGRPLKLVAVSSRNKKKKRGVNLSGVRWETDAVKLATAKDIDVVVEVIGGSDGIARKLVETALKNGKHVVTANKALLAVQGASIFKMAGASQGSLSFEAAVAGGIPIIRGIREGLSANKIRAVYGILNGTCNYILSSMRSTGSDFGDVLKEAQELGYAEADPSFDVDGIDAGHKTSLLAALAFGGAPRFKDVAIKGIRQITALDIEYAEELGYRIKLLGIARNAPHGVEQSVEPCMIPASQPIAAVDGALNAVYVDGDFVGNTLFVGRGAGGGPTASAVVSDIVAIARGHKVDPLGVPAGKLKPFKAADIRERVGSYYLRLIVLDQPGVIASISAILRDCKVSLESVLQRGRDPGQPVPVILTSHETREHDMQDAVRKIAKLRAVVKEPYLMRIETFGEKA